MRKYELLAPVSNLKTLKVAIQSGANAVYCSLETYNARWKGSNLSAQRLGELVGYAHYHDVKVFLTLNVLFKECDLSRIDEMIHTAIAAKVNAVIVQDIGILVYIAKNYPQIHIHASTQTAVANHYGVDVLCELGVERVILARELSVNEISRIKNHCPSVELEIFAHGGQCVAYSGQCYSSGYVYGLSGNRGMCEALCCEEYTLFSGEKPVRNGKLLKPDDLYSLDILDSLKKTGVMCFKIQGRTRSEKYLETVTSLYSDYITNDDKPNEIDIYQLKNAYPRRLTHGNLIKNFESRNSCSDSNKVFELLRMTPSFSISYGKRPNAEITVCLLQLNPLFDYSHLSKHISALYLPYELFEKNDNHAIIASLCNEFRVFIIMPQLILEDEVEFVYNTLDSYMSTFHIAGFLLSNISDLVLTDRYSEFNFRGNYTLNVTNSLTADFFAKKKIELLTLSPELSTEELNNLNDKTVANVERMIYGHPILMKMKYCPFTGTTECNSECNICHNSGRLSLQSSEFGFDVLMDHYPPQGALMSKKILSLRPDDVACKALRFDFLYESVDEINRIITLSENGYFLIGKQYKNSIKIL